MIVSWNWLKEYVTLDMPVQELERRLMMAGLNHESTSDVDGDIAIDLEVTSNRPDCLGHLGIAREISVLWERPLKLPPLAPKIGAARAADLAKVSLHCPDKCPRYTGRIIRGVKVGPSPTWLTRRLKTIGIAVINNIVDITNYVLMEFGQPLHAFDLAHLKGPEIIVRPGMVGETLEAIDHKTYTLTPDDCVIADKERAVALGGIMGGKFSEVSPQTVDLLIEAAEFAPRCIRATARRVGLHSDSSYRFERGVDPQGVDAASLRACDLILNLAGGELADGVLDVGRAPPARDPVKLRLPQLARILGIRIEPSRVVNILTALGGTHPKLNDGSVEVVPPSWRPDLTREIDLVEEVARIHGYETIPEDVTVPMAVSSRAPKDRFLSKIRQVLTACGFDEALTLSAVDEEISSAFSPWTEEPALVTQTPVLRRANHMRRSLIPSLLAARRINESVGNTTIELFEIANIYLPKSKGLPREEQMLGIISGGDFLAVKGVVESILAALNPTAKLSDRPAQLDLCAGQPACFLNNRNEIVGLVGEVSTAGLKQFELRHATTIAEIRLAPLLSLAIPIVTAGKISSQPAMSRDINLVVDEGIRWADVERAVLSVGGPSLESLNFKDVYRDPARLGENKKSFLFSITLRAQETTLTHSEADQIRDAVVDACRGEFAAELRA